MLKEEYLQFSRNIVGKALGQDAHCLLGMVAICTAFVTNQSNCYLRRSISLDYIGVARCPPCVLLIPPVMPPPHPQGNLPEYSSIDQIEENSPTR